MKIFEGIVVTGGKNKTVVVEFTRRTPHPLYKKLVKISKKLKADTGEFEVEVGNKVKIAETRPISKDKYFKVIEIIPEKYAKKTAKKVKKVKVSIEKSSNIAKLGKKKVKTKKPVVTKVKKIRKEKNS